MATDAKIEGPYQFQRKYKADPNDEWHDVDYARVHWALRIDFDDPLGLMAKAIAEGEIIETPYTLYRAVKKGD